MSKDFFVEFLPRIHVTDTTHKMYKKNNKVQSSHYKKSYIRNVKLNTSLLILDFGGTKREFYLL